MYDNKKMYEVLLMNDNVKNKENKQHHNNIPSNKAELKFLSAKTDRVFVYVPNDADDVNDDGVV